MTAGPLPTSTRTRRITQCAERRDHTGEDVVFGHGIAGCRKGRAMNRLQRARVGIGGKRGKLAGVLGYHLPNGANDG